MRRPADSSHSNSTSTSRLTVGQDDDSPTERTSRSPAAWHQRQVNLSKPLGLLTNTGNSSRTPYVGLANSVRQKTPGNAINSSESKLAASHKLISRQLNKQLHKQLMAKQQQQQQKSLIQSTHFQSHPTSVGGKIIKGTSTRMSSSPSVATTSSDDREEVPIVRHSRRMASRSSNPPSVDRRSMVSQMARHSQRGENGTSVMFTRHPTLRSSRSMPGLLFQTAHHQQQQIQVIAPYEVDNCPVHGGTPMLAESINNMQQQIQQLNAQLNSVQQLAMERTRPAQLTAMPPAVVGPAMQQHIMRRYNSSNDVRRHLTGQSRVNQPHHLVPVMPLPSSIPNGVIISQPNSTNVQIPSAESTKQMTGNALLPMPLHPINAGRFTSQSLMAANRALLLAGCIPPAAANLLGFPGQKKVQMLEPNVSTDACCRGHLIVLWLILAVVIFGLISCIVLGVTIN